MFEKNKLYKRSELHDDYGGNRQRGISNCPKFDLILIFTNPFKDQDIYIDEWKGEYFHYSGEGRSGDMTFTGGNFSISCQPKSGKQIHLFEKTKTSGYWKYIDQLRLVDIENYRNLGDNGVERQAFQFVLLSVTNEEENYPDDNQTSGKRYDFNKPNTTERQGLVTSRVGQGYYRQEILKRWENQCAVSGLSITKVLIASHILPWKESNDNERLDVGNGILLSPNLDALFDKHLISFENNGEMIISNKLSDEQINILGINSLSLRNIYDDMFIYLEQHRNVFYEKQS